MARPAAKAKADPLAKLDTEVRAGVDPRALRGRPKNARFMTSQQMRQLVDNVKRDGRLTSLPLVRAIEGDQLEIVSGHHRVEAAIKAGFESIDVLTILTPIDDARITAIQLSHNAITGQDDRSLLADLYGGLDLDERRYSGLTDDMLGGFDKLGLAGVGVGTALYEDLHIAFLPDDREQFLAFLKRLGAKGSQREVLVARFDDFDGLFETLIRVKASQNVQNVGIAMTIMAQLAIERLDQLDQEQAANGPEAHHDEAEETPAPSPSKAPNRAERRRRAAIERGDHVGSGGETEGQ